MYNPNAFYWRTKKIEIETAQIADRVGVKVELAWRQIDRIDAVLAELRSSDWLAGSDLGI